MTPGVWVLTLCLATAPVRRVGSDSCWVRATFENGDAVCLTRATWQEWISGERTTSCGQFRGRYRVTSPLQNDPGGPKVFRRVWVSKSVTWASGEMSPIARMWRALERIRESVSERFESRDRFGVFRKLILNQDLPDAPQEVLRQLGFVHVFTASGLHLYALAQWMFGVSRRLGRACHDERPARGLATVLTGGFALTLWGLAGFRPGFLRPWILVGLRFLAIRLGFRWTRFGPLVLALGMDGGVALVRLWQGDPEAFAPGRLHYALAVGGGLLALEMFPSRSPFVQHVSLSIGSWLVTAIWDAFTLHVIAWATPVLSLVTIPWLASVATPVALLSAWLPEVLVSSVFEFTNLGLEGLAKAASAGSLAVVGVGALGIAVGISILLVFWPRPLKYGVLSMIVALGGCFRLSVSEGRHPDWSRASVEQLDVGQGDAALVWDGSERRVGMIDTGSGRALGLSKWIEIFASRGIWRLDFLATTHRDEDHSGNLEKISGLVPVQTGGVPFPALTLAACRGKGGRPHKRLPANGVMTGYVIPLVGGGTYVNLGDAHEPLEVEFLRWVGEMASPWGGVRIWKVSHHGSKTSTGTQTLEALFRMAWAQGSQAWISVGAGNSYGHPSPRVVAGLKRLGLPIFRTDERGVLRSAGN